MTQSLRMNLGLSERRHDSRPVINSVGPKNLFWLTPFGLMVHLVLHNSIALVMCHHQNMEQNLATCPQTIHESLSRPTHTHLTKVVKNIFPQIVNFLDH